jgi:fructose-1,6-bisphosphatase
MPEPACRIPDRVSLNWHLRNSVKVPDALRHLIIDVSRAARDIRYALQTSQGGLSGGTNQFGETQLKLDIYANNTFQQYLCESGTVCCVASEENDAIIELSHDAPYSVVYDPLDGSSLVDANFAIGSIFGIYPGSEIIGRAPREQVAAGYVLYGPRTILVTTASTLSFSMTSESSSYCESL